MDSGYDGDGGVVQFLWTVVKMVLLIVQLWTVVTVMVVMELLWTVVMAVSYTHLTLPTTASV